MKQYECPQKGDCWSYGNCETCAINVLINRYQHRITILEHQVVFYKEQLVKSVHLHRRDKNAGQSSEV